MIENNDDFNRKIQEYNAILKIVTILSDPSFLTHDLYYDDNYEKKETRIYFASKMDNINALNIFDGANLLPDEIKFANGLLKEYEPFDLGIVNENQLWEDQVYEFIKITDDNAINLDDGKLNISYEPFKKNWFTLKTLKSNHRNKRWFRKSKNYINDRIKRLLDENIIVNIGKDSKNNHNVFTLNTGLGDSVYDIAPKFNKRDIDKGTNLFKLMYPNQVDEYLEFLENDNIVESSTFDKIEPIIPNLPYLDGVYDGL